MDEPTIFRTTPRIIMGPGAIRQIGQEAHNLRGKRSLIVTDKGVTQAGLLRTAEEALKEGRIKYAIFDGVAPDSSYRIVAECVEYSSGKG